MKKFLILISIASLIFSCAVSNPTAADETTPLQGIRLIASRDLSQTIAAGSMKITELSAQRARFEIILPGGQAYVEVFVRQNGIQNVAQNIVSSGRPLGGGLSVYSFERDGYKTGDSLIFRFYSYLPASPGVFTPGPAEFVWVEHTFGQSRWLNVVNSPRVLGETVDKDGRPVYREVTYSTNLCYISQAGRGWGLYQASPVSQTNRLKRTTAELEGIFVKKAYLDSWVPVETTPYRNFYAYSNIEAGFFNLTIHGGWDFQTAGILDTNYCENWRLVSINTFIGMQSIPTDGKVTFAYLVLHR